MYNIDRMSRRKIKSLFVNRSANSDRPASTIHKMKA